MTRGFPDEFDLDLSPRLGERVAAQRTALDDPQTIGRRRAAATPHPDPLPLKGERE